MKLEIFGWSIEATRKGDLGVRAEEIRQQFETGCITKVEAVRKVRGLFIEGLDDRGTLKGALYFVERRVG